MCCDAAADVAALRRDLSSGTRSAAIDEVLCAAADASTALRQATPYGLIARIDDGLDERARRDALERQASLLLADRYRLTGPARATV